VRGGELRHYLASAEPLQIGVVDGWALTLTDLTDRVRAQESMAAEGASRAMNVALRKAGITAHDIDYVNAHGTSTALNDKFETMSIKNVFGEAAYTVPVSSTKSMVGHTLGAAGGVEAAVTVLSLRDQRIHGTIHLVTPDPDCDLDFVADGARTLPLTYAMSNSLGFGGHNSSLIFARYEG